MTTIFWPFEGGLIQICLEAAGGSEREPRTNTAFEPEPETPRQIGQSDHWPFHDYAGPWFAPARRYIE